MLIGPVFYILGLIALVMVFIAAGKYMRNARRQRLMKQPFPSGMGGNTQKKRGAL